MCHNSFEVKLDQCNGLLARSGVREQAWVKVHVKEFGSCPTTRTHPKLKYRHHACNHIHTQARTHTYTRTHIRPPPPPPTHTHTLSASPIPTYQEGGAAAWIAGALALNEERWKNKYCITHVQLNHSWPYKCDSLPRLGRLLQIMREWLDRRYLHGCFWVCIPRAHFCNDQ